MFLIYLPPKKKNVQYNLMNEMSDASVANTSTLI